MIWGGGNRPQQDVNVSVLPVQTKSWKPSDSPAALFPPCGCGLQFRLSSSNSGLYNPQKRPNTAFHRGFCHRLNKKRFFYCKNNLAVCAL